MIVFISSLKASLVKETAKLEKLLKQEDNCSIEERQQVVIFSLNFHHKVALITFLFSK